MAYVGVERKDERTRIYPICCTSAFCGKIDCDGCRNKPVLDEFKAWSERTKAVRPDWIWCPSVWEATVPKSETDFA